MRLLHPRVFAPGEANSLVVGTVSLAHPLVRRIIDLMPNAKIVEHAYARVEAKPDGHDWHVDTGTGDHMPWCGWSASVLLTPPNQFKGGVLQFDGPLEEHLHYLGAMIYSSDQKHRVTPHTGARRALLVFLGADDGE